MKDVIGLFDPETEISVPLQQLRQAGFSENHIGVIASPKAVNQLLDCKPVRVITYYAAWGAGIGASIYAIFAVFAGWCQCNLLQYGQAYGVGTFLGGILAGTFVGGLIGTLVGAAESEKETHLYVQGVRMGGTVLHVEVNESEAARATAIFQAEYARGIKTIVSRR